MLFSLQNLLSFFLSDTQITFVTCYFQVVTHLNTEQAYCSLIFGIKLELV